MEIASLVILFCIATSTWYLIFFPRCAVLLISSINGLRILKQPWNQRLVFSLLYLFHIFQKLLVDACPKLHKLPLLHLLMIKLYMFSFYVDGRKISALCQHLNRADSDLQYYTSPGILRRKECSYTLLLGLSVDAVHLFYACFRHALALNNGSLAGGSNTWLIQWAAAAASSSGNKD